MASSHKKGRRWVYGIGAVVLVILLAGSLHYFKVITIPFLPAFGQDNQVEGEGIDLPVLTKEQYEAEVPEPTEDNRDERLAMIALEEGSLEGYVSNYNKILNRYKSDTSKLLYYYGQRAANLLNRNAAKYKEQIIADATKMNELSKEKQRGASILAMLYDEIGDRNAALHWEYIDKQVNVVDPEDRARE